MMSCFEGALEYYRVTKDEKYLTAAVNYGRRVAETDVTVIGCCGCTHELFDNSTLNQTLTTYEGIMQETCVTVTWMKFCTHLLALTGDSFFADEIEKAAYNAMYGSVNYYERPENCGLPFDSYSPLRKNVRARGIGGLQKLTGISIYGCCACIGSAGLGLVPQVSLMGTENGFVQNLFVPGVISAKTPAGAPISVTCNTLYPSAGRVELTISMDAPETFDYAIRIPGYSKATFVTLNGEMVPVETENGYLHMNREWKNGDTVVLHLDFSLRVIHALENPADENAKYHVAFAVGPVVLARDARVSKDVGEAIALDESKLRLVPVKFADFDTLCEYELSVNDTDTIRLIDYQSAGKTWNKESEMECWIPIKK
ncbi:MAG: glycoside hydrolase family 127 protein [Clostridia bacterium]|nr:glycoside hydrolase family 127 protein [Clostridia bacterium]